MNKNGSMPNLKAKAPASNIPAVAPLPSIERKVMFNNKSLNENTSKSMKLK